MKGKPNNKISFYIAPDVQKPYVDFKTTYPHAGDTAVINAALRFYLAYAKDGVDGNLQPYKVDALVNEKRVRLMVAAIMNENQVPHDIADDIETMGGHRD